MSCACKSPPAVGADADDAGCSGGESFALRVLGDDMAPEFNDGEIIIVDELLQRLAADHPRQAKALEMRIFGGIAPDRIGIALGLSATQAKRDVAFARTWLVTQLDAQRQADATDTQPKSRLF